MPAIIVGAGQAGLAASHALASRGIANLVLEQGRVGEAWLSQRWDSFCLVTPNWTITLPGGAYAGDNPDGFLSRDAWIAHLRRWVASFVPDIRCGVKVHRLFKIDRGFRLDTSAGPIESRAVIVATGTHQAVRRRPLRDQIDNICVQLDATEYRNPGQLAPGGVLVIGAGQSGCQIAEEVFAAGRRTLLCVGTSGRLPRRYRGRDCIDWQNRMGWLDRTPSMLADPRQRFRGDPHVTGQDGGRTLSLHDMARSGITLLGRVLDADGAVLRLAPTVHESLRASDDFAMQFCRHVDGFIDCNGLSAPPDEEDLGFATGAWPPEGPETIDLKREGIATVVWASGFCFDFSWIELPVLDTAGYPASDRGLSAVPGLAFMGLNWMAKRKSGIIYGVGEDAAHVADRVAAYLDRTSGVRSIVTVRQASWTVSAPDSGRKAHPYENVR